MKRPVNFARPATPPAGPAPKKPAAEPADSSGPAKPAKRAKPAKAAGTAKNTPAARSLPGRSAAAGSAAGKSVPAKPFSANEATTEPITVQTTGSTQAPANTQARAGARAVPGVRVGEADRVIPLDSLLGRPDRRADAPAAEPTASGRGARAARSVLRGAQRARKRFERDEVRRFTWRARRRRTTWIVGVGGVVVMFGLIIGAAYSPLMALRSIEVLGTSRIPADQVTTALEDQLGRPLPLIDFAGVKTELSHFSLIQSFVTESRPPNTLVVRIVERVPVGVLATPAGFDLVDAAGVVIESTAERMPGYPIIDAPNGAKSAGFTAAAAVLAVLPASIRTQLDSVAAVTTDDVTLSLLGGERVVWGSPEKSEYKAVVLAALLVGHPAGSVNEYDVSSPDSAVLR